MSIGQRIIRPETAFSVSPTKQKRPRIQDGTHLAFIRTLKCCICGAQGPDAAHIRSANPIYGKRETGGGEKASDKWTVPLCRTHHDEQHSYCDGRREAVAEIKWWASKRIDPFGLALALYAAAGDDEIAEGILQATRVMKGDGCNHINKGDLMESRPKFSSEIARLAAIEIVGELVGNGYVEDSDRESSINDLAKHGRRHSDGYEIAKNLDLYARWDCNFQIAEILDGFGSACDSLIHKAEKDWAARTSPQPPYPILTRVVLSRGETGTIDGIYEHGAAQYLVKVDGDKNAKPPQNSRRIINFEDAKPQAEAVA